MRIARAIASLLVLISIAGPFGWLYGQFKTYSLLGEHDVKTMAPELGNAISLALFSFLIGVICLLIGIAMHILIAKRTSVYPRHAWFFIMTSSVLFLLVYPLGTVIGGLMIVMLFTLQIFKRMRTIKPGIVPLSGTLQMDHSDRKC